MSMTATLERQDESPFTRNYTMRDSPIERMSSRGVLTGQEFAALMKFRQHWFHGGVHPAIESRDIDRIAMESNPATFSDMAKAERRLFHRRSHQHAVDNLAPRQRLVLERVVCEEQSVEAAGRALGWLNASQARAAALELLRSSAVRLAQMWGIAER